MRVNDKFSRTEDTHLHRSIFERVSAIVIGVSFIVVGLVHFIRPSGFIKIVPSFLPGPIALVYISGFFEILGGIGMMISRYRRITSIWLIVLLIAVFPANIYMAMYPDQFAQGWIKPWMLYVRLPYQPIFIWWIWWVGIRPSRVTK